MKDILLRLNSMVNTVVWMYILLPFVFIGGLFLTFRTKGVQFMHFNYAMKNTFGRLFEKKEAGHGAVTPLQAVTTALAATIGTGNIIGTSQAIAMGGYGAVFWLWIAALFGMAIKYSEVTLSIQYRERDRNGDWVGGPMYYITKGLGKNWRWLAVLFAIFAAFASFGIGNMSQANSISSSVNKAAEIFIPGFTDERRINILVGIVLASAAALVMFGGIKRIGKVTEKFIPFMSILYILFTLTVIFGNIRNVGDAFKKIFIAAFNPQAILGAASGIAAKQALRWGLQRSAFSNEAGLGSAGIAHAAAETKSAVYQGFYGIFEVFVDTVVICTLTALTIIVSGVNIPWGIKPGSELIISAFATVWGEKLASLFVSLALTLFAFSTIIGWSLYGTRCVQYLFGIKASKFYQIIFVVAIVVGATTSVDIVWDISDTFNGLMSIPNFIALFALAEIVARLTKEHFRKKK